jgi:hypothetical protein
MYWMITCMLSKIFFWMAGTNWDHPSWAVPQAEMPHLGAEELHRETSSNEGKHTKPEENARVAIDWR